MDLTTAITDFQQARTVSNVQMRVSRKLLESQELQGACVMRLIEVAARVATQAGGQLVAAATGLGRHVDAYG